MSKGDLIRKSPTRQTVKKHNLNTSGSVASGMSLKDKIDIKIKEKLNKI